MKVFIVMSSLFALCMANGYGDYGHGGGLTYAAAYPAVAVQKAYNTGSSTQSRKQDSWGNYAFSYDEQHATGGSSRAETGDSYGNKEGSYSLNVGDGRKRVVKYVADGHGFRASIQTNEPGIVAKAPADVSITTPHAYASAPVYAPAAPVYAASAYAAPAYAAPAYAAPAYAAPAYAAPAAVYSAAPAYQAAPASYGAPAGYGAHY